VVQTDFLVAQSMSKALLETGQVIDSNKAASADVGGHQGMPASTALKAPNAAELQRSCLGPIHEWH
jgi:hypothetical protein